MNHEDTKARRKPESRMSCEDTGEHRPCRICGGQLPIHKVKFCGEGCKKRADAARSMARYRLLMANPQTREKLCQYNKEYLRHWRKANPAKRRKYEFAYLTRLRAQKPEKYRQLLRKEEGRRKRQKLKFRMSFASLLLGIPLF